MYDSTGAYPFGWERDDDVLSVNPPTANTVRRPYRRWFWLQHGCDQFADRASVAQPDVTCLVASEWWATRIRAMGGRAIVTGLPHLDWLPEIPEGPHRGRTLLYLPLPRQFGRVRQWRSACWMLRSARQIGARLAVNVRAKDGCPPWLRWLADEVGVDDAAQPPSILVRLRHATTLFHHDSTAALEASAAGCYAMNVGSPGGNPLPDFWQPRLDLCGPVGGNTERVVEACA